MLFAGIIAFVTAIFSLVSFFLLSNDNYHAIKIQAAVCLLSLVIFILSGGLKSLFNSRDTKKISQNLGLSLYSLLFISLLVFFNYLAIKNPLLSYDSTEQKIFSLAPQTKKIIAGLDAPVTMRAFFVGGAMEKEEKDLLKRVAKENSKISFLVEDPEENPGLVEKYRITQSGTVIFSSEGKEARILGEITEETIVNAFLKLGRNKDKIIYYISGHGEPDLESQKETGYFLLKEAIASENLILKKLLLNEVNEIKADAIILAAPKRALTEIELGLIKKYLENGGSAVFLSELSSNEQFNELLSPYGITVGKNLIIDQVRTLNGALGVQPMVTFFTNHPLNADFDQSLLLYTASSVNPTLDGRASAKVKELAFSSKKSWAETNLELILSDNPIAKFEENDEKGPIPIAATYSTGPEGSKIVVFGDSDFVNNFNIRELFNRDYFLNALNWTIGEEKSISIRARTLRESTSGISQEDFSKMFLFTAILFPEAVLIFGLFIWWRRRS